VLVLNQELQQDQTGRIAQGTEELGEHLSASQVGRHE